MTLSPGVTIGSYTVLELLGSGGMGEVYRARDRRLGREVALKVLPEDSAKDAARLKRLEQEARAASALNHPNIVVVYEIGDVCVSDTSTPLRYIAMELVKGRPLSSVIADGPLALKTFLHLASQISDGVASAHEVGLLHRDLKPTNVLVTSDGHAKILDFGLAKQTALEGGDSAAPTEEPLTEPGTVVGTAGYMAPEQVRGEPATAASDQFALGCMFYEMLTGRRAFRGNSRAEVFSAVLRDQPPPVDRVNPNVPPALVWIVDRCLDKSPKSRYASTRDLAHDLAALRDRPLEQVLSTLPGPTSPPPRRRRVAAGLALGACCLALGGLLAVWIERSRASPLPKFHRLTFRQGIVPRALFVPRSNAILYAAAWDGKPLRTFVTTVQSAGHDRPLEASPQLPLAFSGDGAQVLVQMSTERSYEGSLGWWPALGGKTRRFVDQVGVADWSAASRRLVVVRNMGAERVLDLCRADGGVERTVFRTSGNIGYPRFSPDGGSIAFFHHPSRTDDAAEVRIVSTQRAAKDIQTERFESAEGLDWNGKSGEVWFTASRSTYDRLILSSSPSGKLRSVYSLPGRFILQKVSEEGSRCLMTSGDQRVKLTAVRPATPPVDLSWLGWTVVYDLSADGRTVLFYDNGPTAELAGGIWIRDLEGGDATYLGEGEPGRFSPDGRWVVALTRPVAGAQQIQLLPVGSGSPRVLTQSGASYQTPSFWGPRKLLFERASGGRREICRLDLESGDEEPLGITNCTFPAAAPDLGSLACIGGDRGESLFVYPLSSPSHGRSVGRLSDGRFIYVRWDEAGRRLLAATSDARVFSVDVGTGQVTPVESLAMGKRNESDRLLGAALAADAGVALFSNNDSSSALYLVEGLK